MHFYHSNKINIGDMVKVLILDKNDEYGYFTASLVEYENYSTYLRFVDATRKRKRINWNKILKINDKESIVAKVLSINEDQNIVNITIINIDDERKYYEELFNDNYILTKLIFSFVSKYKEFDYDYIWKNIIHKFDRERNVDDNESTLNFIKDNYKKRDFYPDDNLYKHIVNYFDDKFVYKKEELVYKFTYTTLEDYNKIIDKIKLYNNDAKYYNGVFMTNNNLDRLKDHVEEDETFIVV
jgi:translation initiation factor 2 alpha subunit (eIF-2alpha)